MHSSKFQFITIRFKKRTKLKRKTPDRIFLSLKLSVKTTTLHNEILQMRVFL